jgi:carbamoyl-phosphate synthase large subunit
VQQRLSGREFTVDALTDRAGEMAGLASRWRTQTRGGISTLGTTFADPAVAELVTAALGAVGLVGPANVQGFQSEDGAVAVTEINPRFSGGLPLSLAAGADLVGEYVRAVRGRPIRRERLVATPGVTMRRYFEELFEWPPADVEDS